MVLPAFRRLQVGPLHWRFSRRLSFCVLLCVTAAGCGGSDTGPEREAVSGMVTREGLPIDNGAIRLTPKAGGPAAESNITDGRFEFTKENGPVAGEYDVIVMQHARREEVPEGTPLKDANFIPEDRFEGEQPQGGWKLSAAIQSGQTEPLSLEVTESVENP